MRATLIGALLGGGGNLRQARHLLFESLAGHWTRINDTTVS